VVVGETDAVATQCQVSTSLPNGSPTSWTPLSPLPPSQPRSGCSWGVRSNARRLSWLVVPAPSARSSRGPFPLLRRRPCQRLQIRCQRSWRPVVTDARPR